MLIPGADAPLSTNTLARNAANVADRQRLAAIDELLVVARSEGGTAEVDALEAEADAIVLRIRSRYRDAEAERCEVALEHVAEILHAVPGVGRAVHCD